MTRIQSIIRHGLPLAVVVTALCGLTYLATQQALRHAANDPQIQMAEDAADALAQGATIESQVPAGKVALERSLAPFVMVLDGSGQVVASSGLLDGNVPTVPQGVINYVRDHGEDRVTWQPAPGVRVAAVVVGYQGAQPGFVLVGRSLRETEKRVGQIGSIIGLAWLVTLAASLVAVFFVELALGDKRRDHVQARNTTAASARLL